RASAAVAWQRGWPKGSEPPFLRAGVSYLHPDSEFDWPMTGRVTEEKKGLWQRIKRLAMTDVGALVRGLNADDIENLERVLIEADFGVPATLELVEVLESGVRDGKLKTETDLRQALVARL